MSKKITYLVFLVSMIFFVSTGCAGQAKKQPKQPEQPKKEINIQTLTALKTDASPDINGEIDEMWKAAEAIKIDLKGGGELQGSGGNFNNGATNVTVKALYDNENLYMMLEWADPSESRARGPWIKENGKLVKKDYNEFYEDKLAINWNIDNSVKGFNESGCFVTCHSTGIKDKNNKTIIKHYTSAENEKLDMWHWKLTRQNTLFGANKPGLMHDQYMDNEKFDPNDKKKKGAGRHSDPGDKEYTDNATGEKPDWGEPKLVFDGKSENGNPYIIVEGIDKTKPFTNEYLNGMKDGDFIPGAIAKQITGDPADITAKGKYQNGKWVLEIKRKLLTDSDKDIQFKNTKEKYTFAIAAFDNSQIGHAYQKGVNFLVFK